jgi:hypothetical protein
MQRMFKDFCIGIAAVPSSIFGGDAASTFKRMVTFVDILEAAAQRELN